MVFNISTEILSEINFCLCHDGVTFTWLITRFPEVPAPTTTTNPSFSPSSHHQSKPTVSGCTSMSLTGRLIIDRIKRATGRVLSFPCPPYGTPAYWDNVYRSLGKDDNYEWGSISAEELLVHRYRRLDPTGGSAQSFEETTLREALNLGSGEESGNGNIHQTVLLLGCGNSRFGESLLEHCVTTSVMQVDVASSVVESMSQRCADQIEKGYMEIIEDDATELSLLDSDSIQTTVDKGLIDALFCADEPHQIQNVLESVHRVTKPGGMFCVFSFSRPEFLLPSLQGQTSFVDIEIRELDSILMYRCHKPLPVRKILTRYPGRGHQKGQKSRKGQTN